MKLKNVLSIQLKSSITILAIALISGFLFSSQTSINNYLFTLFAEDISATISVDDDNICINETTTITFTGLEGTAPYRFIYRINGVTRPRVISEANSNTATIKFEESNPGDYEIEIFSVQDEDDQGTIVELTGQKVTITINTPPTVDFSFDNDICANESVQFTSTETGNADFTYLWNFGDGRTSTEKDPAHLFNSALGCGTRNFDVTLTVTDKFGCSTSKVKQITIKEKPDVKFRDAATKGDVFSNCDNTSSSNNFEVTVENISNSSCISSYLIDWGDGSDILEISDGSTFPRDHTYTKIGDFTMKIRAIGTNGCENEVSYKVINDSNPAAGLENPGSTKNLCKNKSNDSELTFGISGFESNSLETTYEIDFGDGTPLKSITHSQLLNDPDFTKKQLTHKYEKSSCSAPNGEFIVTLFVKNACDVTTNTTDNIVILGESIVEFDAVNKSCVNTPIFFDNQSIIGDGLNCNNSNADVTWKFGDGPEDDEIKFFSVNRAEGISYTFSKAGTYNVTLSIDTQCGTVEFSKEICIEPEITPTFSVNNEEGCIPFAVTTSNTTDETELCSTPSYEWNVAYTSDNCGSTSDWEFTNDTDKNSENPQFLFKNPGKYSITQKVTTGCGIETSTQIIDVKKPPTTAIDTIDDFCGTTTINPTATVENCTSNTGDITYNWTFTGGNPTTANTLDPGNIVYSAPGIYEVTLVVTSECGASNTATQTFEVFEVPAITNANSTQEICSGQNTSEIIFSPIDPTITYTWTAISSGNITGFTTNNTTDRIPSQPLINSGNTPETLTYTVIPSLGKCEGDPFNFVITVNPSPLITTQPTPSEVCLNGSANTLEVTYQNGTGTPTYQWFSNTSNTNIGGTEIVGATDPAFDPPTDTVGETFYYAEISFTSGGCSEIVSNPARVNVTEQLTINPVAAPQTICVGGTADEFEVTFSGGTGTPSYQWYSNTTNTSSGGTAIPSATNNTYTPPAFTTAGDFFYYAEVTLSGNGCNLTTSEVFQVTVIPDPVIDAQPIASQELCQGATPADLSVTVSGGTTSIKTYQWFINTSNNTTNGTAIVGETSPTYSPETANIGTFYYYVVISQPESGCAVTSDVAALTINEAPVFTRQPTPSEVCLNGSANTLEVTYQNGTGTPTYQWFSNTGNTNTGGTEIIGATDPAFDPPTDTVGQTFYYAEISFTSGGCSEIVSNPARVNVTEQLTINPVAAPQTICVGGTADEFEVTFSGGTGTPSYQWYSNTTNDNSGGTAIPSATNNTYTPPSFAAAGDFFYYVTVSLDGNGCTNASSDVFEVNVLPDPVIDAQPIASQELCQGATPADLSVTVSGGTTSIKTYQWFINTSNNTTNGTAIVGENSSTYSPETANIGTFYYYVVISQPESGCAVTSDVAALTINEAPVFTRQPTPSEVCLNGSANTLEVTYQNGTGTPTYQWFSNTGNTNTGGTEIIGATDPAFDPPTDTVGETFYYAEISFTSGGCSEIVSNPARVNITEQLTINPVAAPQTICLGGTANEFEVTYTGGTGTPSYQWYSNTTNDNSGGTAIPSATNNTYTPPSFNAIGDFFYYIEVSLDGNGCANASSEVFEVNVLPDPVIDAQPIASQELCQGATPADLSVTVSGGTTSIKTYQWFINTSNNTTNGTAIVGENSSTYSPETANIGTFYYYVVISQPESGCAVTSDVAALTINEAPVFTRQPTPSEVCLNGSANTLEVAYENGTGTPTYQWFSNTGNTNTGGTEIIGATDPAFDPPTDTVGETFYYAEISFASGGCSEIVSNPARVNVTEQLTINPVAAPQTICVGGTADEFEVTFSGGTGTPSYQWYSNTSNDNSGGTAIPSATNNTYTPPSFNAIGDFFYYIEVSLDGNGCANASSEVFQVTVIPDPVIDAQPIASQELCQGATPADLSVTVSGGTTSVKTYQWFINTSNNTTNGTAIVGENSSTYSPETANIGTFYYYVVISQPESGCAVTSDVAALTINEAPVFTRQPTPSEVCLNGSANTLEVTYQNGTGTPTYQWFSNTGNTNTGGDIILSATNSTFDPPTDVVGEVFYYAEISFTSGGCDKIVSSVASVIVNQIPVINDAQITIYSEDTFTFLPNAIISNIVPSGTQYTWSAPTFSPVGSILGASEAISPQNVISQTLENTGTSPIVVSYVITPATASCSGDPFTLEVTVNPNISSNTAVTNILCFESNDGRISTNIEGGIPFSTGNSYLISWSGPNAFASTNPKITNLEAGLYTLRIEDSTGFFIIEEWLVTQPDILAITTDLKQNISCFQGNDGTIEVSISGGTNPYTYNWTTTDGSGISSGVKNQNALTAGTYILEVIDENNCTTSTTFVLTEPDGLNIVATSKQDILCFGDATGAVSITVTGGTRAEISPGVFDYLYSWTGPNGFTSTTKDITNLIAGTYTLAVTDDLGCTTSTDIIINQSPDIEINFTKTDVSCYGEADGALEVLVTGGAEPYQISWSNFGNGFSQSNLTADTYIATITDANNCIKQVSIDINQPIFFIDPVVTPISCNGENDGSIDLNLTGGVAPITLIWDDDPSAGVKRNNLPAGTYTVLITDSATKQCPIEQTFIFTNPPAIAVSSTVTDAIDCAIENSGSIDLSISGGTAPFTFTWSNGATSEDLINIPKGDYSVEIKDANGCVINRQFSIFRQDPIEIDFIESFITNCETKTVAKKVEALTSGGFLPHTLNWSSGTVSGINDNIMTTTQKGAYVVTVTDNNGCVQTKSILIDDIPTIGDPDFRYNAFALSTYDFLSIEDPIQFTNLSSGNYNSITWDFGDGSPIVKEENPIHTYDSVGTYTVKLTVEYDTGCVYIFEREVNVTIGYKLINPNAFTPNGDGYNETIRPNFTGFTEIEMNVYNTWGTLVYFEKGTNLNGWDGTIKDTPAENGNYIMVVKGVTFYNKVITTSTPVTLLK